MYKIHIKFIWHFQSDIFRKKAAPFYNIYNSYNKEWQQGRALCISLHSEQLRGRHEHEGTGFQPFAGQRTQKRNTHMQRLA